MQNSVSQTEKRKSMVKYHMRFITKRIKLLSSYKTFLTELIKKEFKVRYSLSYLGLLWIILEPLITVVVLSLVFTYIGRVGKEGIPFPVFYYSAILLWRMFSACLTTGPKIFIKNKDLISKIRYPKWLSVVSEQGVHLFDFLFANIAFIPVFMFYAFNQGYYITWWYLLLPILMFMTLALSFGIHLILGSINVYIRDIEKLTGVIATVWFFATPIIFYYPFAGNTKIFYYINPMAGIINTFREIIINGVSRGFDFSQLYAAGAGIIVFNVFGVLVYKKLHRNFVDVL